MNEEIHSRSESGGKVRLMFQDEAGFGRINKPKYCWCQKGIRPSVPCHHIREYRYASEDASQTLDRLAAQNMNIIRKWCLSILKVRELFRPNLSMKNKRFIISMNPPEFLEQVLAF